jgi:hypothetical protein
MLETRIGTLSSKRAIKQLLNPDFEIDQRSFSEVINYIVSYLKHLNFYTLQNESDTTWEGIERGDSILFMSTVIATSTTSLDAMEIQTENYGISQKELIKTVDVLLNWYEIIDGWKNQLLNLNENDLANSIVNMQDDVLNEQRTFLVGLKDRMDDKLKLLSAPTHKKEVFKTDEKKISYALHAFKRVLLNIKKITVEHLQNSFYSNSNHTPQSALYIAFTLLLQQLQNQINGLNQRHLDFYYSDILNLKPNEGVSAKTVVTFELLPNVSSALIEENTKLTAGKMFGSEEDILFSTDKPIVTYQIELAELQTLYLQKNPFLQFGTEEPLISSISKNILLTDGKLAASQDEWYVFGANKQLSTQTAIDESKTVELGCIISSQILHLSEGKRTIQLKFNLNTETNNQDTETDSFWDLMNQIVSTQKIPFNVAFSKLFDDGLIISYSTLNGWVDFTNYVINCDVENAAISLHLVLNEADDQLTIPKNNIQDLAFPSVKVSLNNLAPCFLYSFVNQLSISTIEIDVSVQGIKNLAIYNNIGIVPQGKPFDLFGPLPAHNSYLIVGKSEVFQKQVSSVAVHINWDNLPIEFGGLETYYSGYSETFLNPSFKVGVQALVNYNWTELAPNPQQLDLFKTQAILTPEGYQSCVLETSTTLNLENFNRYIDAVDNSLTDPLLYSINSSGGFIKFSLKEPSYGFGMDLYQKDYSSIAMYNAKNKTQIPFPNRPFVPKVASITLDYASKEVIQFDPTKQRTHSNEQQTAEFFHISPFGLVPIIKNSVVYGDSFFYNLKYTGYLYIGLKGIDQLMSVSLFFDLLPSSTTINISEDQILQIEYFQLNKWIPFKNEDILVDNTNKLVKSGIVELVLHKFDADKSELYWIRVSTKSNPEHYPKIKGIYFNAVEVTCISEENSVIGKVIPMGSISKFVGKQPNVKSIIQPQDSLGGKIPEDRDSMYIRISERLRHKNRALSIWDYERLVLERFNDISVVKCINQDADFKVTPGRLKVILLSQKWTIQERFYYGVEYLDIVQEYLTQKANAFTKIEVINPTLETLIVNTTIEFMPEDNGGYYLNLLNKNITDFLSPTVDVENGANGIGDVAIPSKLENFIEKLPFIKSVHSLCIEHIIQTNETTYELAVYKGSNTITPSTPWSMLSPVENHKITVYDNQPVKSDAVGLDDMVVGLDFIIGPEIALLDETKTAEITSQTDQDSLLLINTNLL